MKETALLAAFLCFAALAADDAVVGPNPAANRQSAIGSRQSSFVDDFDAITIPQMLSYQGKLTDTLGQPVPNGSYSVVFKLYAVPTGGSSFWSETQSVTTRAGLFSVLLGSVTPIGSMPDAGAAYLGMAVEGGAELTPRLRIASAAYAYLSARAANADLVQGKDTTGFVRTGQGNSVTSAMITNATIAAVDLGQMGAASGQVMKWTGSAWAPRNDSVGSGGVPDSVPGSFAVTTDLRVYGKGRIGLGNSNAGNAAFVAGEGNTASANYASVSGGADNSASGVYAHIGGGGESRAAGDYSTVAGGAMNYASGGRSTVAGGSDNEAYGPYAVIGGGLANVVGDSTEDSCATVAGGSVNAATDPHATVGGGRSNAASGDRSTVGGGDDNEASGSCATVGGGRNNTASGQSGTIAGGFANEAGMYSAIPGGRANYATGSNSLAAGTNARARHLGGFVWGDDSEVGSDETVYTTGANQWRVRARGGAWFYSNLEKTTGVRLYANGNSWVSIGSDCGAAPVPADGGALLERLAALPVLEHGPRSDDSGTRGIGPAARDFHAAFGYGPEDGINMADADGVALAAIQALYEQVKADRARIAQLEAELARIKK